MVLLENAFILGMLEYQLFFEDINEPSGDDVDGEFVYTVGLLARRIWDEPFKSDFSAAAHEHSFQ